MNDYIQASNRKPVAAHGAAHDQPQNRRAETTPDKSESALVVDPKGELTSFVLQARELRIAGALITAKIQDNTRLSDLYPDDLDG